jgi:hypothetical protein
MQNSILREFLVLPDVPLLQGEKVPVGVGECGAGKEKGCDGGKISPGHRVTF